MLSPVAILLVAGAYLALLFAIAWYAGRRADAGRSLLTNGWFYVLSLAVYTTTWTFYGSVGRAAVSGVGFLPIYLGPMLMAELWWWLVRPIVRISKRYRVTSIADFVSSRYGKSPLLGGLVTVIALVGILPYIALQLKAVSSSYAIVVEYPDLLMPAGVSPASFWADGAFYTALLMAAFTIAFGTRHLDASERHEGMVAAIAFESIVKLVAFLAVGIFVTWGMFGGIGDIFARAAARPDLAPLLGFESSGNSYGAWFWLIVLSMFAIILLPRQFQVAVVENVSESHLKRAMWLFPLYLLAMNIFVLPIALGGLIYFGDAGASADTYVLTLPMAEQMQWLALLVFIGGLAAATGMIIVETIALSTMLCNDLVMPVLLRWKLLGVSQRSDLTGLLLAIRRGAILLTLLLGYLYYRAAGDAYALVAIGLISFAAVAQFAPAMLLGLFWRGGTRAGALAGLVGGFAVWLYTLLLPSFAKSGWLPISFIEQGPWGWALLRPQAMFGLDGLDEITHAMIWSMLFNVGLYLLFSLRGHRSPVEAQQAALFVDVLRHSQDPAAWRGSADGEDLRGLLERFVGPARAAALLKQYASRRDLDLDESLPVDASLVRFVETQLAGVIGSASARVMIASVAREEHLSAEELRGILDEASQVIVYSHRLEQKSRQLEAATVELRAANERLTELDRLKDDFVSTVSHELRTPLTSIRAFAEILRDNPDMAAEQRSEMLAVLCRESERLSRLINQVLDLAKLESGQAEWQMAALDMAQLIRDAVSASSSLFSEREIAVDLDLPAQSPPLRGDRDRLTQVLINLLSNAAKFAPQHEGRVRVLMCVIDDVKQRQLEVRVIDNGPGIAAADQNVIFERFRQGGDTLTGKPQGSGLGLPISRQIIEHLGGRLWLEDAKEGGACFAFRLPLDEPGEGRHDQDSDC